MKTEDVSIKHLLTEHEVAQLAREQSRALGEVGVLESELSSIKKDYGSRADGLAAKIRGMSSKIESGFEIRSVKHLILDERPDAYRTLVRLDTGHISKRRKLEPHERQQTITEAEPKPYICSALLQVDDPAWDVQAVQLHVHEDEFEARKGLPDVQFFPVEGRLSIEAAPEA